MRFYIVYFSYKEKKEVLGYDVIDALMSLTKDEQGSVVSVREK